MNKITKILPAQIQTGVDEASYANTMDVDKATSGKRNADLLVKPQLLGSNRPSQPSPRFVDWPKEQVIKVNTNDTNSGKCS